MDSNSTSGKRVLDKGDFTKVQDADGNVQEHSVPKAWVGTDLLPKGWAVARSAGSKTKANQPKE